MCRFLVVSVFAATIDRSTTALETLIFFNKLLETLIQNKELKDHLKLQPSVQASVGNESNTS